MFFSDKLISLLRIFSKYELNRFRKYLQSPYFNEQADIVSLFEYVNKNLRQADSDGMQSKETVWKALFPNKPFDDADLRRLASELTQMALEYLAQERYQKDRIRLMLELQQALQKPGLSKHLSGVQRQLERAFEQEKKLSVELVFQKYEDAKGKLEIAALELVNADFLENLLQANHHLEVFSAIQKMKFYAGWLLFKDARQATKGLELPPNFLEKCRELYADNGLVRVYIAVIQCLENRDNETYFHQLLAETERQNDLLPDDELRRLYKIMLSYGALKINQGKTDYYKEVFLVYKTLMEKNLLIENDILPEGQYKNVITSGLRAGAFEWVEMFIRQYSDFLPEPIRENARTYNLANLYSHQKKHDKVIELLRNVGHTDMVYSVGAKLILLRTYYESDEFNALDSLLDSFRIFLQRKTEMSKDLKKEYLNLIFFVRKLTEARSSELPALRTKVEECPSLMSKKWLLEKIDEKKLSRH